MRSLLLLAAALVTLFTSCIKNLDSNVKLNALKAIVLYGDQTNMVQGDSVIMRYALTPANYDQSLTWHSSDTTVVAIKRGGKLCARNTGVSNVTVSNRENTVSASCQVTVSSSLATVSVISH